jgi:hypothetical protein
VGGRVDEGRERTLASGLVVPFAETAQPRVAEGVLVALLPNAKAWRRDCGSRTLPRARDVRVCVVTATPTPAPSPSSTASWARTPRVLGRLVSGLEELCVSAMRGNIADWSRGEAMVSVWVGCCRRFSKNDFYGTGRGP